MIPLKPEIIEKIRRDREEQERSQHQPQPLYPDYPYAESDYLTPPPDQSDSSSSQSGKPIIIDMA